MNMIFNAGTVKAGAKALEQWYNAQDEAGKAMFRHACIGGAIAAVPFPFVGEVAVIANQLIMYGKLNQLAGVKFSDKLMKNIGKFLLSQMAGVLGGLAVLLGAAAVMKFIPVLNFVGGAVSASAAGVANYLCGITYWKMLGGFIAAKGDGDMSDAEILKYFKGNIPSEEEIRKMHREAKAKMSGANYNAYKNEAEACARQARR